MQNFLSSLFNRRGSKCPKVELKPSTWEHQLLMLRTHLHQGNMPIECVREMNEVFDKHYKIGDE